MQLHLGCWHRHIPGFIHIDLCDMPHIDYKRSIDDLSIFSDNSIDLIYSSHSFEYFDRIKGIEVLKEWHRVLKPKGILRIAVPDFDQLVTLYNRTGEIEKILGPLYGRMEIQTEDSLQMIFHKTVYNFKSLKSTLEKCGFSNIHRYDWRNTIHKDFDDHSQAYYPHMDKEHGLLLSLNVEAIKL